MIRLGQFTPQLKLLFHTERINHWLEGENVYPVLVEFDLSNACNHKCNFCNFSHTHNLITLDKQKVIDTVREFMASGVKAINWTGGGEPLTNKHFCDIARFTVRHGIQQGIFTNGSLMDDGIMKTLVTTQQWIRFSIDAGTRETYLKIKGVDDFDKVIGRVNEMVAWRNEEGLAGEIGIGFVITPDNYKEIETFSELIKETGVDYGQYKPSVNNCSLNNLEWWTKEVKPRLEKVFNNNHKAVINLYKFNDIVESNLDLEYDTCYGHHFCPCIGADGEVYLCNQFRGDIRYSFGSIYKNTFRQIWNSNRRKQVIKNLDITKCPNLCKNNEINKILYRIKHPTNDLHYNFL
jgi:radical SAM protein with 4Fe4S-binding SPASM domain